MAVDRDAIKHSNMSLGIIFTTAIIILNGLLVGYALIKGKVCGKSKHPVIFSLAVCDFVVGVFFFPIFLQGVFEDYSNWTCEKVELSNLYFNWFSVFVSGCGLVALSAECILRKVVTNRFPRLALNGALMLTPWILGLVIIFPLSYSDCERDQTPTIAQRRSVEILSTIVPGVLTIVASVCVTALSKRGSADTTCNEQPSQRERTLLLVMTTTTFLLTLPTCIFNLIVISEDHLQMSPMTFVVFVEVSFWLKSLKSVILPILLYIYERCPQQQPDDVMMLT